jgi:hypothetical protein
MGILFKTYQRRHQLHVYNEVWSVQDKEHLEEVLSMFKKEELLKAKIVPGANNIDIELNGLIIDCRNLSDLKRKFGQLAEIKEKYQKILPPKKKPAQKAPVKKPSK